MNCPQCSSEIILKSSLAALVSCYHCASSLLIEPTGLKLSDIKSDVQSKSSLVAQGHDFIWRNQLFQPQGFVQLQYAEGYRKEWWVLDNQKNTFWLSEEDENFFLLQDKSLDENVPPWLTLQVNTQLQLAGKSWLVTEKQKYQYNGFQGQLPYLPNLTNALFYTYLTGENAETMMLIFEDETIYCRQGYWLDPFEIEVSA